MVSRMNGSFSVRYELVANNQAEAKYNRAYDANGKQVRADQNKAQQNNKNRHQNSDVYKANDEVERACGAILCAECGRSAVHGRLHGETAHSACSFLQQFE